MKRIALSLLGFATLVLAAPPAHAAFPGDNGLIAFSRFTHNQNDIWVVQPVPEEARESKTQKSRARPTESLLTLTTCSEIFHTDNRSVVFGELVRTEHV